MLTIDKEELFDHLIEKHVDEAAFLWLLRSHAVNDAVHTPATIAKLELRINNHFDGMTVTPASAWRIALKSAELSGGGEIFVLAVLALTSGSGEKINLVLDLVGDD